MQCIDHGKRGRGGNGFGYHYKRVGARSEMLHRVVYSEHYGVALEDMQGMVVMHTCDNPRCINPDHLKLGTQADNMKDMQRKGRWKGRKVQVARTRKMSVEQRKEALALLGTVTQKELAARYNVSQSTIARLKDRLL